MKRLVIYFAAFVAATMAVGCELIPEPVEVRVQLVTGTEALAVEGVNVSLVDALGIFAYQEHTDASGVAVFSVLPGSYVASATYKAIEDGKRVVYNGSNPSVSVVEDLGAQTYNVELQKVESQQLVIKELYMGGCPKNEGTGAYSNDAYIIVYNNSEFEADATDLVFGFLAPYNGHASNKFYERTENIGEKKLIYETDNWLPAAGAMWSFTAPVTIPAYSQVVVAVFGAIDHTATVTASVNLANAAYYWMSNSEVPQYTNAKYAASDVIPTDHYLTSYPFNMGNAWVLSNSAPAFFIGNMSKAENARISADTENYDLTNGTTSVGWSVKFPKAKVVGAVEVFSASNIEGSLARFSADINTGYVALSNQKGYSIYRNVDKEATEALPENEGKLVYDYAGGTLDVDGTTDPSGIDAEASIANGAHIIYSQTNDSGKDFHQRKTASLKK